MLGLKCVAFGISVSVLLAQSTTSQKAPNIPAGTPLYPPRIMHWCSAHCTTLTLDSGPPFDRPHYGKQGSEQIIIVERWTSDSVLLNRRDNTSRFKGTAILRGRISTDGNSIVDGKIEWTSGNTGTYGYQAAWGAAINTVPGSDAERDRARPPSSNPSGAISTPNSREDLIPSMSEPTAAMKSQKADLNGDWEGYFNSPMFAEVMRVRQTGKNISARNLSGADRACGIWWIVGNLRGPTSQLDCFNDNGRRPRSLPDRQQATIPTHRRAISGRYPVRSQ